MVLRVDIPGEQIADKLSKGKTLGITAVLGRSAANMINRPAAAVPTLPVSRELNILHSGCPARALRMTVKSLRNISLRGPVPAIV